MASLHRARMVGIAAVAFTVLAAPALHAQGQGGQGAGEGWSGSVGLGAAIAPDNEGSNDYRVLPAPRFELRKGPYGVKTNRLGLEADVTPWRRLNAGPIIRYDLGRDDDVDDARVSLLDEVDPSLEIGGHVSYAWFNLVGRGDFAAIRLSAVQDVAGGHEGLLAEANVSYFRFLSREFRVGAILGTSYGDDDFMDAYFGVDAAESARSGLSRSEADGGFKDVSATLTMSYQFTDSWGINGAAGYKRLIGDAADSAVVDEAGSENQAFGAVGFSYRF